MPISPQKWRRTVQAEAEKVAPGATVAGTNGGHLAIKFPNGSTVYASATPSDCVRAICHVRAQLRRAAKGLL